MKNAIIIPTYNERDNIVQLIPKILSLRIESLHVVEFLIIPTSQLHIEVLQSSRNMFDDL